MQTTEKAFINTNNIAEVRLAKRCISTTYEYREAVLPVKGGIFKRSIKGSEAGAYNIKHNTIRTKSELLINYVFLEDKEVYNAALISILYVGSSELVHIPYKTDEGVKAKYVELYNTCKNVVSVP